MKSTESRLKFIYLQNVTVTKGVNSAHINT